MLLPRDLHPDITMTVTGVNAGEAAAVARWAIVERGLPLNFNLYRAGLLEKPHNELRLEEETIVAGLREAFALIEQHLPARPFLGSMLDRFNMQAHAHTCGAGQSYVVIGHTGTVDACQMHMGDDPRRPHACSPALDPSHHAERSETQSRGGKARLRAGRTPRR